MLGNKGLAISVSPGGGSGDPAELEPWGRTVLQVSAFNDMCGDYFDMLHVKVCWGIFRRLGLLTDQPSHHMSNM